MGGAHMLFRCACAGFEQGLSVQLLQALSQPTQMPALIPMSHIYSLRLCLCCYVQPCNAQPLSPWLVGLWPAGRPDSLPL